LNKKSGLVGISGISGDMREIVAAAREKNPSAKFAFDIFVHASRRSSAQWRQYSAALTP
jgi:acetate kinase